MTSTLLNLLKLCLVVAVLLVAPGWLIAQIIYGSSGCSIDTNLLDENYPAMREWAKAGVEGGIKPAATWRIKRRLSPGDDIQTAVEQAAKKGGGVVLLRKGIYPVYHTIHLLSNTILRGEDKAQVQLHVYVHGTFIRYGGKRTAALHIGKQTNVGIENLTIEYKGAAFEPYDKDAMQAAWDIAVYHQREKRDTSLFVDHIWIDSSKNCWVQNCNLVKAGCDPMHITRSEHITCRNNYIDRSYNKNDGGMGYYNIIGSQYILICNEHIRRIRHFAIHIGSQYIVAINNYLEVDINFHDGDNGNCLVQGNFVRIPRWHSWSAIQRGDPRLHRPPGRDNFLYNNDAMNKDGKMNASLKHTVYKMDPDWKGKSTTASGKPGPKGNTLYPVICNHTNG